jgi:hypothetical protein
LNKAIKGISMDELYDMLESGDKPFQQQAPKQEYRKFDSNRPKKVSLWDKVDFTPIKINLDSLKRTKKTFSFFTNNSKEALPEDVQDKILKIARVLFGKGYTFRYNGDKQDALGLKIVEIPDSKVECYLPWKKFNEEFTNPVMSAPSEKGYGVAINNHSKFLVLPPAVRAILAREAHVILGTECTDPLDIAIMYNLDGSEVVDKTTDYKKQGNTTFPIKILNESDIPVFNFKSNTSIDRLIDFIKIHHP